MTNRRIPVFTAAVAGLAIAITSLVPAQVKPIPVTDEPVTRSEDTQVMMQAKLSHAHQVL